MSTGILLKRNKAIYFPIPKVASASVKMVLASMLNVVFYPHNPMHRSNFPTVKVDGQKMYADYFKFCFVRNPWDRVLSCYKDKIRNKDVHGNTFVHGVFDGFLRFKKFKAGMRFDEFVEVLRTIADREADPHFKSQYTFVINEKCEILVDFTGKFENLDRDFFHICRAIGLTNINLPHLNKKEHGDYRKYYTKRTRSIIGERYSSDIKMFKYDF